MSETDPEHQQQDKGTMRDVLRSHDKAIRGLETGLAALHQEVRGLVSAFSTLATDMRSMATMQAARQRTD